MSDVRAETHTESAAFPPSEPKASPSLDPQGVDLLEHFDNFAGVRNAIRHIAQERQHWAGIPMPLEGQRLVIEPSFPLATEIMEIGQEPEKKDPRKIRNSFYSNKMKSDILIFEHPDGRVDWGWIPAVHHFMHDMETMRASVAWGIEQEHHALQLLGTLLTHHQFKGYLLTGMFIESSKRSGLMYVFRKLKPTVVLRTEGDEVKIRCCLCMHPIAFYEKSWAGAMCPTDDVIAHLLMMRGDEPMFWRRSNQHPAWRPEAGL